VPSSRVRCWAHGVLHGIRGAFDTFETASSG
jgi:hypothetical protein